MFAAIRFESPQKPIAAMTAPLCPHPVLPASRPWPLHLATACRAIEQAAAAPLPPHAWWLLLGNMFWVLAYDTEYAMVDRDDDLKIGMKTSAITLGRFDVAGVMAFYVIYLVSWALLGRLLGLGGLFLLGVAVAALQAAWHFTLIRSRSRDGCFKAFRLNHWLGFAIFAGVALDLLAR
jgi:4-hydroxybenzoate polyprenyltransferase